MIPLSLVIARRGNGGALRTATEPRPRPTVFSTSALVAAVFFFFVLGALVGAGLAHASPAPWRSVMHNTRVERLADTREDEKDIAAAPPPHFEADDARARRDIDRWMDGGEPFRDGGIV